MPMRCRWPPEKSAGYRLACSGLRPTSVEQLAHPAAPLVGVDAERPQRLGDDVADRQPRVERGQRVLEDHLDVAPELPAAAAVERGDVACPSTTTVPCSGGSHLEDLHDRRRLAAAGLADQAERLALADVEADAVDGVIVPIRRRSTAPLISG